MIRFRDTLENRLYRACWLYTNDSGDEWRVKHKSATPEPAPSRYCA
jgi:hypothetical protein